MYHVQHHSYCGLSGTRHDFDSQEAARLYVAERLHRYRSGSWGYKVVTLKPGRSWEILEPEDCTMVPDACGTLSLTCTVHECRECGFDHDTQEQAQLCCASDLPERELGLV